MADLPILFSAPMVRGLIREVEQPGTGKTQTRRLLTNLKGKGPISEFGRSDTAGYDWHFRDKEKRWHDVSTERLKELLRWHVGDRLYVREAWAEVGSMDPGLFITRADYPACVPRHYENVPPAEEVKWRPGIHMPRARSRLTLTVTDVRVQRLQECSRADALAEGVEMESADPPFYYVPGIHPHSLTAVGIEEPGGRHAERSYAKLWDHINGAGSWAANPWIVALTFTVERRNIDSC